jgi:hypothetical protein
MSSEEYDWVFDFVMGYLASEEFSSAMLDFVDGACVHFTETEENLLIYSDIHEEYKDHVGSYACLVEHIQNVFCRWKYC